MTLRAVPPVRKLETPNRRLDSWKEIAVFFNRDERTVRRWEKERSLPVHRLPGSSRARVFTFTDQLLKWMHSPSFSPEAAPPAVMPMPLRQVSAEPTPFKAQADARRRWIVVAAIAGVAMVALILTLVYRRYGFARIIPARATAHNNAAANPKADTSGARPVNPEAQELYLKGRYYWDKRTPDDLNKAVDFFTQAIVRDPSFSLAYVGLADCITCFVNLRRCRRKKPSRARWRQLGRRSNSTGPPPRRTIPWPL